MADGRPGIVVDRESLRPPGQSISSRTERTTVRAGGVAFRRPDRLVAPAVLRTGAVSVKRADLERPGQAIASRIDSGTRVFYVVPDAPATGGVPFMIIFSTSAPIPSGTTTYFGAATVATDPFEQAWPVPRACNVEEMAVLADGPAGAGQTFTYTLWLIPAGATVGSATILTGTITGATSREARLVPASAIVLARLDKIICRLQTSAGAAVVNHRAVPLFSF